MYGVMSDRRLPPPGDPLLARLERLERQRQGSNGRQVPTSTAPRQFAPPTARQAALQAARQYAPQAAPQPAPRPARQATPQASRLAALQAARQPAGQPARPPVGRQARRKRPARIAKFGALALSCATTAGLVYLFADINTTQAANQALAALPSAIPVATGATPTPTAATTVLTTPVVDAATTVPAPTTIVVPVVQAFNGDLIDTRFGPVQVQLQFTNGAISEVAVVAYPNGDGTSVRINARALPELRTEVLAAQSAQINSVSGATYTSHAYEKSLQSAIDQARAAGATAIA